MTCVLTVNTSHTWSSYLWVNKNKYLERIFPNKALNMVLDVYWNWN